MSIKRRLQETGERSSSESAQGGGSSSLEAPQRTANRARSRSNVETVRPHSSTPATRSVSINVGSQTSARAFAQAVAQQGESQYDEQFDAFNQDIFDPYSAQTSIFPPSWQHQAPQQQPEQRHQQQFNLQIDPPPSPRAPIVSPIPSLYSYQDHLQYNDLSYHTSPMTSPVFPMDEWAFRSPAYSPMQAGEASPMMAQQSSLFQGAEEANMTTPLSVDTQESPNADSLLTPPLGDFGLNETGCMAAGTPLFSSFFPEIPEEDVLAFDRLYH
ncbi:hypothetical protein KEM55_009300, partial [Ascosphaera atra]